MNADRRNRIIAAASAFASDAAFDVNSNADVLRAWVNLEAVAKARGSGIGALLTEEGVIGGAPTQRVAQTGLAVAALNVPAPYIAAVAAAELPQGITVQTFPSLADELNAFLSRSAG
jgi:4'-phosphopantetheinyl transferase